jgi:hypothetical protein
MGEVYRMAGGWHTCEDIFDAVNLFVIATLRTDVSVR